MNCLKCKVTNLDQKSMYQCDICRNNICSNCSSLTSTEDRCMGLSKQRTLKFFCSECDKDMQNYAKCIDTNKILLQENKKLQQRLETISNATSSPITVNILENTFKKLQTKLQEDLTETINKLIKNEILDLQEQINNLTDSNKDLVKVFTSASTNINIKPTLFSDIVNTKQNKENNKPNSNQKQYKKITNPLNHTSVLHDTVNTTNGEQLIVEQPARMPVRTQQDQHTKTPTRKQGLADGFQYVSRKRQRNRQRQIGTAEDHEVDGFIGSEKTRTNKKIWIFLSKVKDNVTEAVVKEYISKKATIEQEDVSVKHIKTYHQLKDKNCFLIGVNPNLIDAVYDAKFWPRGVVFDRFNFFKGKHFLENQYNKQNENDIFHSNDDFLSPQKHLSQ